MKIRNGFVSNSSSSSFLIISKNGELTKDILMKAFDINEKSPLYPMAKQISSDMMNSVKEYTPTEYMENYSSDVEYFKEENPEKYVLIQKVIKNNWKIYEGYADSQDEPALCEMDLNYEDQDILIEKEGGY